MSLLTFFLHYRSTHRCAFMLKILLTLSSYKEKTRLLDLGLNIEEPSPLKLDSEITDALDLDFDLDLGHEQRVEVALLSKIARDIMVDLLRSILPIGMML